MCPRTHYFTLLQVCPEPQDSFRGSLQLTKITSRPDLNNQIVPQAMSWQSCLPSSHKLLSSCPGTRADMAAFPSYSAVPAKVQDLPSYPGITEGICHHWICLCDTRHRKMPSYSKKVCSVPFMLLLFLWRSFPFAKYHNTILQCWVF